MKKILIVLMSISLYLSLNNTSFAELNTAGMKYVCSVSNTNFNLGTNPKETDIDKYSHYRGVLRAYKRELCFDKGLKAIYRDVSDKNPCDKSSIKAQFGKVSLNFLLNDVLDWVYFSGFDKTQYTKFILANKEKGLEYYSHPFYLNQLNKLYKNDNKKIYKTLQYSTIKEGQNCYNEFAKYEGKKVEIYQKTKISSKTKKPYTDIYLKVLK